MSDIGAVRICRAPHPDIPDVSCWLPFDHDGFHDSRQRDSDADSLQWSGGSEPDRVMPLDMTVLAPFLAQAWREGNRAETGAPNPYDEGNI